MEPLDRPSMKVLLLPLPLLVVLVLLGRFGTCITLVVGILSIILSSRALFLVLLSRVLLNRTLFNHIHNSHRDTLLILLGITTLRLRLVLIINSSTTRLVLT